MSVKRALLLGNSIVAPQEKLRLFIDEETYLVAVDGGLKHFPSLGLTPDLIIGDLDSLTPELLTLYKSRKTSIVKISSQEETDLEKAFQYLSLRDFRSFILSGFTGKREDHYLANLLFLSKQSLQFEIIHISPEWEIYFATGRFQLQTTPGQLISLITLQPALVLETRGLQYPLKNEFLQPGTRGISNTATSNKVELIIKDGMVLVFRQT